MTLEQQSESSKDEEATQTILMDTAIGYST